MLYKYINENRITQCPKNGTAGGKHISNLPRYLEKHPELALAEGYKPLVEESEPEFNPETQYLTFIYEDTEDEIIKHYEVNDIETESE